MQEANFAVVSSQLTLNALKVKSNLNFGTDIYLFIIGNYDRFSYPYMALTNLRVVTKYSIWLGFVYLTEGMTSSMLIDAESILCFDETGQKINENLVMSANGIKREAFEGTKPMHEWAIRKKVAAVNFFEDKSLQDFFILWWGKVKPYSAFGAPSYVYRFESPLVFPPLRDYYTPFLVMLIGDYPSTSEPDDRKNTVSVVGQLNYSSSI